MRSAVLARAPEKPDARDPAERDRIYAIFSVQVIPSDQKLVEPVDAYALLNLVTRQLSAHGFHQVEKGRKPEILLTVQYGRAWLNNPYFGESRDPGTVVGISSLAPSSGGAAPLNQTANRAVTGSWAPLMSQLEHGAEAKLQEAEFEKLCIKIIAWRYQTDPKARAEQLWRTTMIVDDPDHRDLNTVAAEMLAAGAPFFAQDISEPQATITKALPDGHVKLGDPVVVDPPDAPKAVAPNQTPAPVPVAAIRDESRRTFDLPSGDAVVTLQAFTRQSGEEIIFPVDQVRAITTKRVSGELTARTALDRMLEGTGLVAVQDEKTGALAVRQLVR